MKSMNRMLAGIAVALCFVQFAGAESINKTLAADPRGEVEVSNVVGTVRVIGWDRTDVEVKADLGSNVERLDFKRDGEHVYVKVVLPSGRLRSGDTDLTIHVPKESRLMIHTVGADVSIDGVFGMQRLQTVSGDIRAQVANSDFKAETVSGDITAKGIATKEADRKTRMRVSTVSGSINVENLGDDIEVETVSGDMRVRGQSLTRARLRTTNGSLYLMAALGKDAHVDAESINGELTFNFDGTLDAEFDIETFNGAIENCFGPKSKRTHEYGPGNELRFKEGEGRASVRVKTLNGKVTLCRGQKAAWRSMERRLVA